MFCIRKVQNASHRWFGHRIDRPDQVRFTSIEDALTGGDRLMGFVSQEAAERYIKEDADLIHKQFLVPVEVCELKLPDDTIDARSVETREERRYCIMNSERNLFLCNMGSEQSWEEPDRIITSRDVGLLSFGTLKEVRQHITHIRRPGKKLKIYVMVARTTPGDQPITTIALEPHRPRKHSE